MHIPLFSALSAKKRWNGGAPELMTPANILQAQQDAPYWAKQLRAGNMPAFDVHNKKAQGTNEIYHLERFRFLSYIHNKDFWNALVTHLGPQNSTFWLTVLDSAIESGNVHALSALNIHAKLPLQTLFFEWLPLGNFSQKTDILHPRALEWFATDTSLHELLRTFSAKILDRDYSGAMLSNKIPLWWDAANQTNGAQSVISWTNDWCALPAAVRTTEGAVKNAVSILISLNKRDMDRQHRDPQNVSRSAPESQELAIALEKSVTIICERMDLPMRLIRTLAGRMKAQDLEDPMLCAVVQYQDPHVHEDTFCTQQHRVPLRHSQYLQVVHNAARSEPLPTLLDMHCERGALWHIYNIAEPFVNQRPVQTMALPDGLLDMNA